MSGMAQGLAAGVGGLLQRRYSRRGVLGRAALVGSAALLSPLGYAVRPGTAYASVCGPGTACSDGWSAMCCSINNGVNQCPPGSFIGGWWKADSAGLCGGGARYYIDCQGECTGCGCAPGSSFCAEGCWNCQPYCNSGSCDTRRVCWNVFRYGQCNQQIGCSGPVMCRMISCTPPWQFANCTTDVATDENTVDHSAPCLPSAYTPLQQRYDQMGGPGSVLGAEVWAEYPVPGGTAQDALGGRLFDSAGTGPHWVRGPILARYEALGGPGALGLPVTDEVPLSGGAFNAFGNTNVWIVTSAAGTWLIRGAVLNRWYANGQEHSGLGFPAGEPYPIGAGVYATRFQHGLITDGPAGAFAVAPPVIDAYDRFGPLMFGAASAEATAAPNGWVQRFDRGAWIVTSPAGSFLVPQVMAVVYDAHGGPTGPLGYPVADPAVSNDRRATISHFTGGAICTSAATGTHEVHGPLAASWQAAGAQDGSLKLPISDVVTQPSGVQVSDFEGGRLSYDPATGQVTRS